MILKILFFVFCLHFSFIAGISCASGAVEGSYSLSGEKFRIIEVVKISDIPWGFDFLPNNRIIITAKSGKVFIKSGDSLKQIHEFENTLEHGQGGLMDVKVHPNFSANNLLFFSYILRYGGGIGTVISKATLLEDKITNTIIFRANPPGSGGRHFGSRIVLDNGKVFFGVGDRGERDNAQKLDSHLGKILRINEDGTIPSDNPFNSAVWSLGHRNPQGLYYDRDRKIIWEQEHGPKGGDEINIIQKSKNYGWPTITYGKEYWGPSIGPTYKKGLEQPVKYFIPSIAPSSLMVYSGKMFKSWKGTLFSTALRFDHLNILKLNEKNKVVDESRLKIKERLRHVEEKSETGEIYFSTDSGYIYKITKNNEDIK